MSSSMRLSVNSARSSSMDASFRRTRIPHGWDIRWAGGMETLVVETTGFNGKTWLDEAGHPATDAMHVTERFHRRDFGHMDLQMTIDDSKAYTKPWTVTEPMVLLPDTDLIEYVCNENEKDLRHLGKK